MLFTYQSYRFLLESLRSEGYVFCDYHDFVGYPRCVILRHDIDTSLEHAVKMAEIEASFGVKATYFVLLRTDFYNSASKKSQSALRRIMNLGHEVGLHFDEKAYGPCGCNSVVQNIVKECGILSTLLDTEILTVSMHRPSKATLEADLQIPGIINSYGKTFFREFKYLSDSRRNWREPVLDIIHSGKYDRLHILTHAFWYHEEDETISETVGKFVQSASRERYYQLTENITDINSILDESEVC